MKPTRWKRGNVEKEVEHIEQSMSTELELRNVTVDDLKKTIERIGLNHKPVPNIGRPKQDISVKKQKHHDSEVAKGMTHLFTFKQMYD